MKPASVSLEHLTVSAVERWAEFGPGRQLGATLGSDAEIVVGVGAQVRGQVTVSERSVLTLSCIHPAAVQEHQLKFPEGQRERRRTLKGIQVLYSITFFSSHLYHGGTLEGKKLTSKTSKYKHKKQFCREKENHFYVISNITIYTPEHPPSQNVRCQTDIAGNHFKTHRTFSEFWEKRI